MVKIILAILGLVVVCLNPILSGMFLTAAATRWHAEKTIRKPHPGPKRQPIKNQETFTFTLTKDVQEKNCKRYLNPDFENNPKWQDQVGKISKIRDDNRVLEQANREKGDWT